eukprot:11355133-Karenia_brevis.AAC.1
MSPVASRSTDLLFSPKEEGDGSKFSHTRAGAYNSALQNRRMASQDAWETSAKRPQMISYEGSPAARLNMEVPLSAARSKTLTTHLQPEKTQPICLQEYPRFNRFAPSPQPH